jgi:uncharacterized protein (UPF0332 family)
MDGRDFLEVARDLASGSREADWRSAVSRAYYAAFHVARLFMEEVGFTVPRADRAHAHIWLRLANSGDPQTSRAGNELKALREVRNLCDYDLRRGVVQAFAVAQVKQAEDLIRVLDAGRAEPTRTQITDAMKIYERDVLKDVTWHP